jgi:MoaA/NifB/PqqE/SkfB family radical SAM enzyme
MEDNKIDFINPKTVGTQLTKLFSSIAIEISERCNRHCYFCPNDYNKQNDTLVPIEQIEKVLLQLKELNYIGRIEWYIYNEPTRDKRLIDIIAICKKHLPKCNQMINTNGDYFSTYTDIEALFLAGLNQMQINIYSDKDRYFASNEKLFLAGIQIAKKRFKAITEMVDVLVQNQTVELGHGLYNYIGNKRTVKVVRRYGITPKTNDKEFTVTNRGRNLESEVFNTVKEPLKKMCTRPFRFLNINFKGDATLCCVDYKGETNMGNVNEQTILEIWNSPKFNLYRLYLQNKRRDLFLCNGCDFVGGGKSRSHLIQKITFGTEKDAELLNTDFSTKQSIEQQI